MITFKFCISLFISWNIWWDWFMLQVNSDYGSTYTVQNTVNKNKYFIINCCLRKKNCWTPIINQSKCWLLLFWGRRRCVVGPLVWQPRCNAYAYEAAVAADLGFTRTANGVEHQTVYNCLNHFWVCRVALIFYAMLPKVSSSLTAWACHPKPLREKHVGHFACTFHFFFVCFAWHVFFLTKLSVFSFFGISSWPGKMLLRTYSVAKRNWQKISRGTWILFKMKTTTGKRFRYKIWPCILTPGFSFTCSV